MKRKLAAILAADMVGFSRLIELAEEETIARQRALRQTVFDPGIAEAGGAIIKTTGDGFLAEFPSVVTAVRFAIAAQEAVEEAEAGSSPDRRIRYRIGIHLGDIIVDDGDIYGDGVNLAARLEGIAPAGGICISAAVQDQLTGVADQAFQDIGEQTLKNISRPVRAFVWGGDPPATTAPEAPTLSPRRKTTVALGEFSALGRSGEAEALAEGCRYAVEGDLANLTGLDLVDDAADPDHIATAAFQAAGAQARATVKLRDTRTSATYLTSRISADLTDPLAAEESLSAEIATTIRYGILQREAERAAETGSDDPEAMLSLAGHYMMGSNEKEWRDAGTLLDRILAQQPDNFMAVTRKANTLIGEVIIAYRAIDAADAARAEALLRQAVRLNERSDYTQIIWAVYHYGVTGDLNAARRSIDRAFEINPNFAQGHLVLGWIQNLQGQPEQALESAKRATFSLAKNRIYHRIHMTNTISYLVMGRYEDAIEAADKTLQLSPDHALVLMFMASAAGLSGDPQQCDRSRQMLLAARPDFRISDVRRFPFDDPADWQRVVDGLQRAGLPE